MEVGVLSDLAQVIPSQSINGVGACVTVHHVHQNTKPHGMSLVDQILEILGCTTAAAGSEEVGDMVPEATVVSMLHDCHELNGVIVVGLDSRENFIGELPVGRHLRLL